jgi:hypothetical protein
MMNAARRVQADSSIGKASHHDRWVVVQNDSRHTRTSVALQAKKVNRNPNRQAHRTRYDSPIRPSWAISHQQAPASLLT